MVFDGRWHPHLLEDWRRQLCLFGGVILFWLVGVQAALAHDVGPKRLDPNAPIPWALPQLDLLVTDPETIDGKGYGYTLTLSLQALLPTETHESVKVMPVSRIVGMAEKGRLVCSVGLLKSPARAKYFVFSKPLIWMLPNRLILRRQVAKDWQGAPDGVDLAKFIGEGKRVALVRGRSYGPKMDEIIRSFADRIEWANDSKFALSLVALGRTDAAIDYATSLVTAYRQDKDLDSLQSLAIKGTELLEWPVACTANSRGRAIIEQFDQKIHSGIRDVAFSGYRRGLDPAADDHLRQALLAAGMDFPSLHVKVSQKKIDMP